MNRLIVADDHQIFLDGLCSLLESEESFEIIGKALNGKEVLKILDQQEADVAILDINMPEMDGLETTKAIHEKWPDMKVLILTMHREKDYITSILEAGATGYLLKTTGQSELIDAIKRVAQGSTYYGTDVIATIMDSFNPQKAPPPTTTAATDVPLTKRELELIQLISEEYTMTEIAEKLFISENTVKSHRKNILHKLNLRNTAGLIKFAVQHGLVK